VLCHNSKTKGEERKEKSSTGRPGLLVLDETNSGRFFTEALTAEVKAVLADETSLVGAQSALPATLPVLPRAREPNGVVCHFFSF